MGPPPHINDLSLSVDDNSGIIVSWDITVPQYVLMLNTSDGTIDVTGLNHYGVPVANQEPCMLYDVKLTITFNKTCVETVDTRTGSIYIPPS